MSQPPSRVRPVRRGVIVLVVGVAALGLLTSVAVLFGVIIPRLRQDSDPPLSYPPGELTPEESTVVVTPQPDGTVRVAQWLTFDAGPGTDHPLTWYLGGTRLGHADAADYAVLPRVSSVTARDVTPGAEAVRLEIDVEKSEYADPFRDGRRYALVRPRRWAPGRHRVEFDVVLSDVWVEVRGVRVLVLPLRFASGPDPGQPADQVRLTVKGAGRLDCPGSDEAFADRQECGDNSELLRYRPAEIKTLEAVTVPDPGFITAPPIPVTERAR